MSTFPAHPTYPSYYSAYTTYPTYANDESLQHNPFDDSSNVDDLFSDEPCNISFNSTVPMGMHVASVAGPQLASMGMPMCDPFYPAQTIPMQGRKSIFDYAVPKELAEQAAVMRLIAPQKPWYLMPTHVYCSKPLDNLVQDINAALSSYPEQIKFEFIRHDCSFHGSYYSGEASTDFSIRIYQDNGGSYIVEFHRMESNSDRFLFSQFYQSMQEVVLGSGQLFFPQEEFDDEVEEYDSGYDDYSSFEGEGVDLGSETTATYSYENGVHGYSMQNVGAHGYNLQGLHSHNLGVQISGANIAYGASKRDSNAEFDFSF